MSDISFARLTDIAPRDAWAHEAHAFTPWLAENLDHLAAAIGIPLELTGLEVAVERFAADILASCPQDGSIVLIENQLEATDHSHLGQIMTYLAGLDAQTVVWIAPLFREPHLSAIRWLNEHTADGFSFFAVRVRVVRIGDSPYAPIFEVVEKPSGWERQLSKTRVEAGEANALSRVRETFWNRFIARTSLSVPTRYGKRLSFLWCEIIPNSLYVSLWIGTPRSGIFIRGGTGDTPEHFNEWLRPNVETIAERLSATIEDVVKGLPQSTAIAVGDTAREDELIDWMEERRALYTRVLLDVLHANPNGTMA